MKGIKSPSIVLGRSLRDCLAIRQPLIDRGLGSVIRQDWAPFERGRKIAGCSSEDAACSNN
jgi:hypothetical protein